MDVWVDERAGQLLFIAACRACAIGQSMAQNRTGERRDRGGEGNKKPALPSHISAAGGGESGTAGACAGGHVCTGETEPVLMPTRCLHLASG
eukprot:365445-Chlamydomonas_euryale.AAC.5